jgi:hypothetical protein
MEKAEDLLEKSEFVQLSNANNSHPVQTMNDINQRHEQLLSDMQVIKPISTRKYTLFSDKTPAHEKRQRRKEMIKQYKLRKTQTNQYNDEDIQDSRTIEMPRPTVNLTIEKKALINNSYITRVTSKPSTKANSKGGTR